MSSTAYFVISLPKYLENSNCFPALFAYYMAQGKICGRQPLKNLK